MFRESLRILEFALNDSDDIGVNYQEALYQLKEINFALDEALIIAITDVLGNITFANQKFCEKSKYSMDELIGQNHRIINSGYHSLIFWRDMWKTIANGKVWRGEIRNKAKDGTYYWMDTVIVPSLNAKGKPYQYVSFRNEITTRKSAEEALRRADKSSAVGQMASGFVHEIRNPLAAIKWSLQLLRIDIPERTKDFDAVLSELDRVDGIVGQLLKLAKPHEESFSVIHISEILEPLVNLMVNQALQQKVTLQLTIDKGVPLIRCDPNQLKQVFMNIIQNAVESMSQGGTVTIHASHSDFHGLDVQIIDQGCGIPEEVITRIGEPFLTTKPTGTGLGMMVSHQIIKNLNGLIDIKNNHGKGTTITVSMPSAYSGAFGH